MEVILDNRGVMKRLFGDQREARNLESHFNSQEDSAPSRPPPKGPKPKIQNGKYPTSQVLADTSSSSRHGKKIDLNPAASSNNEIRLNHKMFHQEGNNESTLLTTTEQPTTTTTSSPIVIETTQDLDDHQPTLTTQDDNFVTLGDF